MAIKQAVQFALLFDDADEAAKVLDQIRNTINGSIKYLTEGSEGSAIEPQVKGKIIVQWSSTPVNAVPEQGYMSEGEIPYG